MASYNHIGSCPLEFASKQRVEPGESFSADLAPELEEFLIKIEAIEKAVVPQPKPALKFYEKE